MYYFFKNKRNFKTNMYVPNNTVHCNIIRFAFWPFMVLFWFFLFFFFNSLFALKQILFVCLPQGLLIGAFIFFIIAEAPESYIAITILETCIVVFFILIYMLTLHHLMTYLHWPLLVSVPFHNLHINFALGPRVKALLD